MDPGNPEKQTESSRGSSLPRRLSGTMGLSCFLAASLLWSASASGYTLRKSASGAPLLWTRSHTKMEVDISTLKNVGGVFNAVVASFAAWTSSGATAKFTFGETSLKAPPANDGRNTVSWKDSGWEHGEDVVAITIAWYKASNGAVTETDIVGNAQNYTWGTSTKTGSQAHDVQNVVTHEVGHLLGLSHSNDVKASMWSSTPPGEVTKRSLEKDDRDGLAAIIGELSSGKYVSVDGDIEAIDELAAAGCSMAGPTGRGAPVLLVVLALGLLGLRLRRVLPAGIALLAALALAPGTARATVVKVRSLPRLIQDAPLILRGEVVRSESRMVDGLIITDHTLKVKRCLKGSCDAEQTLRTLGGEVGDLGMWVSGSVRLRKGEEVVVFGRRVGTTLQSLGLGSGLYRVRGEAVERAWDPRESSAEGPHTEQADADRKDAREQPSRASPRHSHRAESAPPAEQDRPVRTLEELESTVQRGVKRQQKR